MGSFTNVPSSRCHCHTDTVPSCDPAKMSVTVSPGATSAARWKSNKTSMGPAESVGYARASALIDEGTGPVLVMLTANGGSAVAPWRPHSPASTKRKRSKRQAMAEGVQD